MAVSGRNTPRIEDDSMGRPGEALGLMQKALALLDATDAPPDVGASLDLAIHRLQDWIEGIPK